MRQTRAAHHLGALAPATCALTRATICRTIGRIAEARAERAFTGGKP